MNHHDSHSCASPNIAQAAQQCLFALRSSMGKLIKNHWARLIILTSACCEYHAAQEKNTQINTFSRLTATPRQTN